MEVKIFKEYVGVFGWKFFLYKEEDEEEDVHMIYEHVYFYQERFCKIKLLIK